MDPNEVLQDARSAFARYRDETLDPAERVACAAMAAENYKTLDEWMNRGGFKPTEWMLVTVRPWMREANDGR